MVGGGGGCEHPEWVHSLFEYFEFVRSEKRSSGKSASRERSRVQYILRCSLCKSKQKPSSSSSGSTNSTAKEEFNVSGNSSYAFVRHLERSHQRIQGVPEFLEKFKSRFDRQKRKVCEDDTRGDQNASIKSHGIISLRNDDSENDSKATSSKIEKYDWNGMKQKDFNNGLVDWIVTDGLPFNITEKVGFRQFILGRDSKITCPSRSLISRRISDKHEQIMSHLKKRVTGIDVGTAHIIFDIWSSRARQAVIGMQIRFIKDWKIQQFTLAFKHFPGTHDATSIRTKIESILKESFDLCIYDFFTVTADNASAILSAFKDTLMKGMITSSQDLSTCTSGESAKTDSYSLDTISQSVNEKSTLLGENESEFEENDQLLDVDPEALAQQEIVDTFVSEGDIDDAISQVIKEWSLPHSAGIRRNSCMAHLLQLGIKDALKEENVSKVVKKINRIVTWFHKSTKYHTILKETTGLGVIKPCDTRWNSTYFCLRRIVTEVKKKNQKQTNEEPEPNQDNIMAYAINKIIYDAKKTMLNRKGVPDTLTDENITAIKIYVQFLEPFAILTDTWQGDYVTSSCVIVGLMDALNELMRVSCEDLAEDQAVELSKYRDILFNSVKQRFDTSQVEEKRKIVTTDIFNDELYILATVLDPRSKTLPFKEEFSVSFVFNNGYPTKKDVTDMLNRKFEEQQKQMKSSEVEIIITESSTVGSSTNSLEMKNNDSTLGGGKKRKFDVFSKLQEAQTLTTIKDKGFNEVDHYINAEVIRSTENPLIFWSRHSDQYPILSTLAKKYLSVPATSASVERIFSVAGCIISARRNSMKIDTTEKVLMYREYLAQGI